MLVAYIPSPSQGVWHLGPVPVRAYALCLILGILAAVAITRRRWVAAGGDAESVADIAVWGIAFGLVGARLYHVLTDPELYFCRGCHPVEALYVWRGGLGIWGAVGLGAVGMLIGCRRKGVSFSAFAGAAAPGVAVGQAIGRWGNYFNQELYGRPTHLPWALSIDRSHRPPGMADVGLYHPTFLYESLWDLGVAALLIWAGRRYRLSGAQVVAVYVASYTAGRGWIEALRIDPANHILGLRLNDWTSIILFISACVYLLLTRTRAAERRV